MRLTAGFVVNGDGAGRVTHYIAEGSPDALAKVRDGVAKMLRPLSVDEIGLLLADLDAITVSRAQSGIEAELRLNAYAQRLSVFPADVVRWALLEHRWHFWPSWAELHDVCENLSLKRRQIMEALSVTAEPEPQAAQKERATAEAMARLMDQFLDRSLVEGAADDEEKDR